MAGTRGEILLTEHACMPPRLELKFILPDPSFGSVLSLLKKRFKQRTFQGAFSQVHSIYLDDHLLSRVEDSLAGLPQRNKLRLRWYDSDFPERSLYLELKERLGVGSRKERCRFDMTGEMPETSLVRGLLGAAPDSLKRFLIQGSLPVVHIRYNRYHFKVPGSPVRITLDRDLYAARAHSRRVLQTRGRFLPFGGPVLEVKVPVDSGKDVAELLSPLNLRKGRFSKYLQASHEIGPLLGYAAGLIARDGVEYG